jgi:integrase
MNTGEQNGTQVVSDTSISEVINQNSSTKQGRKTKDRGEKGQGKKAQQSLSNVAENLWKSDRNGRYYGIAKVKGVQIKKSLKTTDRQTANRELKDWLDKLGFLRPSIARKTPFETLACEFLKTKQGRRKDSTCLRYATIIKSLGRFFYGLQASEITKDKITDWTVKRRGESKCSARTFNYEQMTLTAIMAHGVESGCLFRNPMDGFTKVKGEKRKDHYPTKDEFTKLVTIMRGMRFGNESADLVEALAYSGCRISELRKVTWADIWEKTLFITESKNGKPRHVPLFIPLNNLFQRIKAALPNEPKRIDKVFNVFDPKKGVNSACKTAGLPHMNNHCFRHFFVSNAIEKGIDFATIANFVGHSDGGVLVAKTYGHLRNEHSENMADRMTFEIPSL